MRRHDLLQELHALLEPRTYFEIGVREGRSLALSRARSVAVDPYFLVDTEIRCDVHLVRATSDEFFARKHPFAHLPDPLVDLAFIDGMHLSEYALRDIINTEKYTHPGSVILLDDALPRTVEEAGRERRGSAEKGAWAGDVYKVTDALRRYRPDLVVLEVDTYPTGTVVVLLPDSRNRRLNRVYDDLVEEFVVADPQVPGEQVLNRTEALDPVQLLSLTIWQAWPALRRLPHDEAVQRGRLLLQEANLRQTAGASS